MVCFHQVGQGLFVYEEFAGSTIIYDCGGENVKFVSTAIDTYFFPNKEIDILFISHYDRDHINGIFHLLKTCKVKHVILPLVSDFSRCLSFSSYPGNKFGRIMDFYEDPVRFIENRFPRVACHYQRAFDIENDLTNTQIIPLNQLPEIIDLGTVIHIPTSGWFLHPFNRKTMSDREEREFITRLGLDPNDRFSTIIQNWSTVNNKLKKELINVGVITKQNINDYSMTLYSQNIYSRSLFLGDYNARKYCNELVNYYRKYWGDITCLQIPHHGSIDSFNNNLLLCGADDFIVSNKLYPKKLGDVDPQQVLNIINSNKKTSYLTDKRHVII